MKKKKRFISGQKIFNFVSFIFLLTCCIWYGWRAVHFYLETNKGTELKELTFAKVLRKNNKSFKKVDNDYYFYQDADDNYVIYSGLLFRIVKVMGDNKITMVTDEPVTSLAYGDDVSFDTSPIAKWLNNGTNKKGILENKLNNTNKYLDETMTCTDDVDDIKNITCKKNTTTILSLLTINDYINTGGTKSFINNGFNVYLANSNKDGEKWYITDNGELSTDDGSSIYGVKAVVTLKNNITIVKGDGTKGNPYEFDSDKNYFASYVKLGDDIWRVYDEEDKLIKLSLNNYLKVDNMEVKHIYSNSNSFHNDTVSGSLAYYLNHTYLNRLSYKNMIMTNNYENGYYSENDDYDFSSSLEKKVDTKVGNLSVGNVILNYSLDGYFLSTGLYEKSNYVYLAKKDGSIDTIKVSSEAKIVPCISIDKNKLLKGSGTKDDPYRTE